MLQRFFQTADGGADTGNTAFHVSDGAANLLFRLGIVVAVFTAGDGNSLPSQGVDLFTQCRAFDVEGRFQLPTCRGILLSGIWAFLRPSLQTI